MFRKKINILVQAENTRKMPATKGVKEYIFLLKEQLKINKIPQIFMDFELIII